MARCRPHCKLAACRESATGRRALAATGRGVLTVNGATLTCSLTYVLRSQLIRTGSCSAMKVGDEMRATRMALLGTSAFAMVCLSQAAALSQTAAPAPSASPAAPQAPAEPPAPAAPATGQAPAAPAQSQTAPPQPATAAGPQDKPAAPAEIDMPQVTVEGRQPKPARRAGRAEPGRPSRTVAAPLPGPAPAAAPASPFNPPFAPLSTIGSNQIQTGSSNGGFGSLFSTMPGATSAGLATESSRPILRGLSDAKVRIQENGVGAVDVSDIAQDHASVLAFRFRWGGTMAG